MRVVIQRVRKASVFVPSENHEAWIGPGLLVLAAFTDGDTEKDLDMVIQMMQNKQAQQ